MASTGMGSLRNNQIYFVSELLPEVSTEYTLIDSAKIWNCSQIDRMVQYRHCRSQQILHLLHPSGKIHSLPPHCHLLSL